MDSLATTDSFSKLNKLLIYRGILADKLLQKFSNLLSKLKKESSVEELQVDYYDLLAELIRISEEEGHKENLWQNYLLNLIIKDKNPFSLACEKDKDLKGTIYQLALNDLKILIEIYNFNLNDLAQLLNIKEEKFINNFSPSKSNRRYQNHYQERLEKLKRDFDNIDSVEILLEKLSNYYHTFGAGKVAYYKAFRWDDSSLIGINNSDPITFKELIGYESQKEKLIKNTEAFLNNKPANNVLLYGDSGTGKSSSIKALLNQYAPQGLRLIELAKYQMRELPKILEILKDRGLYFIIFMDDLSFEDFETEYKYMKAIIEGGVEVKPNNVLFYATSNRRHLIKEKWSDRDQESGEIHLSDAIQEKISLASRFGITISYESPQQKDYLKIVKELAKQNNINLSAEELKERAIQWEMWNNGRSGRTAQQFIDYLLGEM
ncbi:hypothetical protein U472_07835 [Orenia metallireducens]|uniref:AAA+ ATPase domain-containing protein n=1 Tax=Orenia metallireducens TaxID=1413210 RepID=A0A1C0AAQ5_9FIRM|nr:ATP-binding protein [Orenia metallireducens]OCL27361.1 hypothetical protein U472_07835 [Orenia metallireducens]